MDLWTIGIMFPSHCGKKQDVYMLVVLLVRERVFEALKNLQVLYYTIRNAEFFSALAVNCHSLDRRVKHTIQWEHEDVVTSDKQKCFWKSLWQAKFQSRVSRILSVVKLLERQTSVTEKIL